MIRAALIGIGVCVTLAIVIGVFASVIMAGIEADREERK